MAKKNNNNVFKGLALAVGAGLVVNELTKDSTPRAANFTPVSETKTTDIYSIIEKIKQDPELMQMLRGSKGDTGELGLTGAAGDQIQNFGGSILKNGAFEDLTLNNWTGTATINVNNSGRLPIVTTQSLYHLDEILSIRKDRLLKYEIEYQNIQDSPITFYLKDKLGNPVNALDYPTLYVTLWATSNVMTKKIGYLNTSNFGLSFYKMQVQVGGWGKDISFTNLILKEVSLGEAVPHSFPFLPTDQEVYDPTTGDRGRFNGTAIDWYTML